MRLAVLSFAGSLCLTSSFLRNPSAISSESICNSCVSTVAVRAEASNSYRTMAKNDETNGKIVTRKGVSYDSNQNVIDCLFCRIQNHQEPARIVYEDSEHCVFKTIAPASPLHLLVTPKKHVQNVESLKGEEDAQLVQKLVDVGRKVLGEKGETALFCFHIPPWNSIDHLHLHAIADTDQMNLLGRIKYFPYTFYCQSADAVIATIKNRS